MSETFQRLFESLRSDPAALEAAKKASLVLQFRFFAPPSVLVLDLTTQPFTVVCVEHAKPDVEIGLTPEAADRLLLGTMSAAEAMKTSVIRLRGGFFKLLALKPLFDVARDAYRRPAP